MIKQASPVATVLYAQPQDINTCDLLRALLEDLAVCGHEVSQARMTGGGVMLRADHCTIYLYVSNAPRPMREFATFTRPDTLASSMASPRVSRHLLRHQAVLRIAVTEQPDVCDDGATPAICAVSRVCTGTVMSLTAPNLVAWHPAKQVFTVAEFVNAGTTQLVAASGVGGVSLPTAQARRPRPVVPNWAKITAPANSCAAPQNAPLPVHRLHDPTSQLPLPPKGRAFTAHGGPERTRPIFGRISLHSQNHAATEQANALNTAMREDLEDPQPPSRPLVQALRQIVIYSMIGGVAIVSIPTGTAMLSAGALGHLTLRRTALLALIVAGVKLSLLSMQGFDLQAILLSV
jgi:hypothetical protein